MSDIKSFCMTFITIFLAIFCRELVSYTVVIDPGHGGKFFGTTAPKFGLIEKNLTLETALCLAKILNENKINAILTRAKDLNFSDDLIQDLSTRIALSNVLNADLFISLHYDHNVDCGVSGFKVYVPMETEFPAKSYKAAFCIHHQLSQHTECEWGGSLGNVNLKDGGIRAAKFTIFKNAKCPALLVEVDYLSNPASQEKLCGSTYFKTVALVLADGIKKYFNIK